MRLRFPWFAAICLVAAALGPGLSAAPSQASNPEKSLRETRSKIRTEEQAIQKLGAKRKNLLKSLEDLDKDILVADRRKRVSEARMTGLVEEKKAIERELKVLEGEIRRQRSEQGRRLAAYYRIGRTGAIPLIFSDASPPEKLRNLDALRRVLVADWERLASFHELLQEKERVEAGLRERLEAEKALQETVKKRKKDLEAKRHEKSSLLFHIDQDKKLHERLLKELREAEKDLLNKMRQQEPPAPVILKGGPLNAQKGKLPWPVQGKIHRGFGRDRGVRSRGIDLKTEPGTPVRAVWEGGVVYADWFRGYGKLLIVHHGQNDYTIVGHLSDLTKRKGDRVDTGEIVGYAGETGSVEGCLVHFEIWHGGNPEDPLQWLRKGGG